MPARDKFHGAVKKALEKDGWTITDDPLSLRFSGIDFFIDLGAERLIAAERGQEKIAVEIKSFIRPSIICQLPPTSSRGLVEMQAPVDQPQPGAFNAYRATLPQNT